MATQGISADLSSVLPVAGTAAAYAARPFRVADAGGTQGARPSGQSAAGGGSGTESGAKALPFSGAPPSPTLPRGSLLDLSV
jgi:hypothetical protein